VAQSPTTQTDKITREALEAAHTPNHDALAEDVAGAGADGADDTEAVITFRVGDTWLAVSAFAVEEICDQAQPMVVPRAPAYVPGIMNLRGHAVPLLDLREFLHLPAESAGSADYRGEEAAPRVLLVRASGMRVGLLCDQVRALEHVPTTHLHPANATFGQSLSAVSRGELVTATLLAVLLDIPALLEAARVRK
jgi:purine-binding chemotaxis protein CheW